MFDTSILDLKTIEAFQGYAIDHWDDVEEFIVIGRSGNNYFQLTKCNKKGLAEILRHFLLNNNDSMNFIQDTISAVELAMCCLHLGVDITELANFIYYCQDVEDPEKLDKEIDLFVDSLCF